MPRGKSCLGSSRLAFLNDLSLLMTCNVHQPFFSLLSDVAQARTLALDALVSLATNGTKPSISFIHFCVLRFKEKAWSLWSFLTKTTSSVNLKTVGMLCLSQLSLVRRMAIHPRIRAISQRSRIHSTSEDPALLYKFPRKLGFITPCRCWKPEKYIDFVPNDPDHTNVKGSLDHITGEDLVDEFLNFGDVKTLPDGVLDPIRPCKSPSDDST